MITQREREKLSDLLQKGVVTPEEADELTAALADSGPAPKEADEPIYPGGFCSPRESSGDSTDRDSPGGDAGGKRGGAFEQPFIDTLTKGAGDAVSSAMNAVFSGINAAWGHAEGVGGNTIIMSKVDQPGGARYEFSENAIKMGKLTDVTLNDAVMKSNRISGSSVNGLRISSGSFSGNLVNAASVVDVVIENGALDRC